MLGKTLANLHHLHHQRGGGGGETAKELLVEEEEAELDDEMDQDDDDGDGEDRKEYKFEMIFAEDEDEEEEEEDEEDSDEDKKKKKLREFRCRQCAALFSAKRDLRSHVRLRHVETCSWTCHTCGAAFPANDVEPYKTHLVRVHKLNKDFFGSDEPELNPLLKLRLAIPEDVHECSECGFAFAGKTNLNLHRLRRHISKRLTQNVACPVCGESAEDLTAHVRSEHGIEGVVCPHCGKILSKTCTLNRHIEQVHLNLQIHKPATCGQCGKVFSKKGHLDRHVRTIHLGMKEASEPCPYCGKVFSTKSSLEPHIEMVHK